MSGPQPGYLATYNSLTDKHLVGYFNNPRIRRHLQRSGLISRSGRIIPEKEYRLNALRRDHQRYVQECLARAIFHKVLDIERHHQLEIKQKLESSVRRERVQKVKMEQFRRSVEGANPMHFPHPPLAPRYHCGLHPLVAEEPASHSQLRVPGHCDYSGGHPPPHHQSKESDFSRVTSWRPNTAPGNMQQPPCLQPLRSGAAEGSLPKTSSSSHKCHVLRCVKQFVTRERSGSRLLNSVKCVTGVSPYQLPAINNYVMPVPPPRLQKRGLNAGRNGMPRGRQFHLASTPSDAEQLPKKPAGGFPRSPLRSNACVTMIFLGKSVHLSHDDADCRDEIKVYQQHCGGENLCVYKGRLMEGETFQFISKRHRGFPFSLTFFLNGIQVDRLSCCCEYKHQKRSRLGGRHGSFAILHVEGASPCYRCIIAMGLDKEPSPPKRKVKEDHEEKHVGSWGNGACSEPSKSCVEQKPRRNSVLVILPSHKTAVETAEGEMETKQQYGKEEMKKPADHESKDGQEDTIKKEYDEDFEADEEVNEEGQTNDRMNGMSKSPSDDKNHNLNYENESKTSSQNALQASDSEEDESDGYSDSSSEDDEQGGRPVHSLSSVSTQYSSEDDSCAETMKDNVEDKEEHNDERASDNTAHAQFRNENGENKLLRVEENQETSVLEKEGIDEAENAKPEGLTARGDTGIFHENITAIQHQSPEVNRQLDQAASLQSDTGEDEKNTSTGRGDGEEGVLVPLESSVTEAEDSSDEASHSDEGGVFDGYKPAQAEMTKAAGNDHHMNSEPEPGDSDMDEEEEHITSAEHGASEAPDAASLAEGARTLDVQKAAKQVVQDGQTEGEKQALEEEEAVAEGGDARSKEAEEVALVGDLLPKEDTVAVLLVESLVAVRESTPEESTRAEGDPKGQETWKGAESGAEVAPGEQEGVMEGMGSLAARGGQEPEAMQGGGSAGQNVVEVVEMVSEAVQGGGFEGQGVVVSEMVSEALQDGGSADESVVIEMVSEGVQDGGSAGQGVVVSEVVNEVTQDGHSAGQGVVVSEMVSEALQDGGSADESVVIEMVSEGVQDGGSAGQGVLVSEVVNEVKQEAGSAGQGVVIEMVSEGVQEGGTAGHSVVIEMVSESVEEGGSAGQGVVIEIESEGVQGGASGGQGVVVSEVVNEVIQEGGSAGQAVVTEMVSEDFEEGGSEGQGILIEMVSEGVQEGGSAGQSVVGEMVSEAVQEEGSAGQGVVVSEMVSEAVQGRASAGQGDLEVGEMVSEAVQEEGSAGQGVVVSEMVSEAVQGRASAGQGDLEVGEMVSEAVQEEGSAGQGVVVSEMVSEAVQGRASAGQGDLEVGEMVSEAVQEEGSAGQGVVVSEMVSEAVQGRASAGQGDLEVGEMVSEAVQEEGSAGQGVVVSEMVSEAVQGRASAGQGDLEVGEMVSEAVQEEGSAGQGVFVSEMVSEAVQGRASAGQGDLEVGEMVSEAVQEEGSAGQGVVVSEMVSEAVQGRASAGQGDLEVGEMVSEAVQEEGSAGQGVFVSEMVSETVQEGGPAGHAVVDVCEMVSEAVQERGSASLGAVLSEVVSEVTGEGGSAGQGVVSDVGSEVRQEAVFAGQGVVVSEMVFDVIQEGCSTGQSVIVCEMASEAVQEGGYTGQSVVEVAEVVSEGMQERGSAGQGVFLREMVSEAVHERGAEGQCGGVIEVVSEAVQEGVSDSQGVVVSEMVSDAVQGGCSAGHGVLEVDEMVSEALQEGGSPGQGVVVGGVCEAEEAVVEACLGDAGFAGAADPYGEEALRETISGWVEAVEKPGSLLESSGNWDVCTGEALPGEDFVKPNVFSQLKASGEELAQKGKARTPQVGEALDVEGSSFLRVEDTVEESVEPGKGPLLQEAPALEALVGAGGDPVSEGSLRLEETSAAEEENGSAEAVLCGNPSPGSKAKTEEAVEGKADGGVGSACVQVARAEPGAGEESKGRTAGPGERADGMGGPPGCAGGTGKAQPAGDGAGEGAAPSAPGRGVSTAGAARQAGTEVGAAGAEAQSSPRQQRGHPGTGAAGSKDGTEQAAGGAQRERSGLHGGTAEGAVAPVPASAQSPAGAGEQGTDSPVGGSPDTPGAADCGERSHSPCEDPAVPDTTVVPPVQPQLGKESCL
ncbi:glutamate-rich protein 3 isoform 4-T4 [Ara ararauna]